MNKQSKSLVRKSKELSWLLRHGATEAALTMDAAGWVAVEDVLSKLRLTRDTLEELVATNEKQRLQLDCGRVRACQGHSHGVPVTLAALEASWTIRTSSASVFHGTQIRALKSIAKSGLVPQQRTHVHLAAQMDSRVGKRSAVDVMLEVDPAAVRARGLQVFEAPNGVILIRRVPAPAVTSLIAMTKRSRAKEAELNALFGFVG